jgi:hypothetical protein
LHPRATLPTNGCHLNDAAIRINRNHRNDAAIGEEDMVVECAPSAGQVEVRDLTG